ncbi:MAG: hypothetical protein PHC61_17200, partial [Chitinivibrionales bacterium]|nr:hypothetical protein [Chitinivibrionales bacterium]
MKKNLFSFMTGMVMVILLAQGSSAGVPAKFKLDTIVLNNAGNTFRVSWTIDTTGAGAALEVGVNYGIGDYSVSPPVQAPKAVVSGKDSIILQMPGGIIGDTFYYISLWVRPVNGPWTTPTAASKNNVRTPKFTQQALTYFAFGDTVFVNGGKFLIWKDPAHPVGIAGSIDTAVPFSPPAADTLGFRTASLGYKFKFAPQFAPTEFVHIGFKYLNLTAVKINIYRDSSGVMLLCDSIAADNGAGTISAIVKNLNYPFIAMIDQSRPQVSVLSDTSRPAISGQAIVDSFAVSDNVGNMRYTLYSSKGDDPFKVGVDASCRSTHARIIDTIPAKNVTDDNGVKAFLVVSDGTFSDTVDLSRRVRLSKSENIVTAGLRQWTPVHTTALLDTLTVPHQFLGLSKTPNFSYNDSICRIFEWAHTGNAANKWIEYSDATDSLFTITPGALFWVKTDKPRTAVFGGGYTLPLKQNYQGITVRSKNWRDFSGPFKFNVRLSDIVKSMGAEGDSLQWYRWAPSNGRYSARAMYIANHPDPKISTAGDDTISGSDPKAAYTVYNPFGYDVTLQIPPLAAANSTAPLSKK